MDAAFFMSPFWLDLSLFAGATGETVVSTTSTSAYHRARHQLKTERACECTSEMVICLCAAHATQEVMTATAEKLEDEVDNELTVDVRMDVQGKRIIVFL